MNKIFGAFLLIVIGLMLIPVVTTSIDTYDIVSTTQSHTAVSDETIAETVVLDNTPDTINSVKVNDVETTAYTLVGSTLTFEVDASTTDDVITVNYDYVSEMSPAVDGLINLLPIVFILILVVGSVAYIKFK